VRTGCADPEAANFDATACVPCAGQKCCVYADAPVPACGAGCGPSAVCLASKLGCMAPTATNYDPEAMARNRRGPRCHCAPPSLGATPLCVVQGISVYGSRLSVAI
jgi:hypothetical protein